MRTTQPEARAKALTNVWYSGGELLDYTGAAVTLVLVVVGFLPPLLELRGKVSRAVAEEMASLRKRLDRLLTRAAPVAAGAAPAARELEERLDEALIMLRISYLEKLYAQLGQSEATDIVIKLLVPTPRSPGTGTNTTRGCRRSGAPVIPEAEAPQGPTELREASCRRLGRAKRRPNTFRAHRLDRIRATGCCTIG